MLGVLSYVLKSYDLILSREIYSVKVKNNPLKNKKMWLPIQLLYTSQARLYLKKKKKKKVSFNLARSARGAISSH